MDARRELLIKLVPTMVCALILGVFAWWWLVGRGSSIERAMDLNLSAWNASYEERGLPVPPGGPRDGLWGKKVFPGRLDPILGWRMPAHDEPGILEVDEYGIQHVGSADGSHPEVLFVGGSVGTGAYASTEENAWFALVARRLEEEGVPIGGRVFAAGAWKSEQEVEALRLELAARRPSAVVIASGLNDLTMGARADVRLAPSENLVHARDWDARVSHYVRNMETAAALCERSGTRLLVVLQPALFSKPRRSGLEEELLSDSVGIYGGVDGIQAAYRRMAHALSLAMRRDDLAFVDCSAALDDERTTFSDLWHFSDPGHEMFARCVAPALRSLLASRGSAVR